MKWSETPEAIDALAQIPVYMRQSVIDYVEKGFPPGVFLTAVLENKLVEPFEHADETNRMFIWHYANLLYNAMPRGSWGSEEKVTEWLVRFTEPEHVGNE